VDNINLCQRSSLPLRPVLCACNIGEFLAALARFRWLDGSPPRLVPLRCRCGRILSSSSSSSRLPSLLGPECLEGLRVLLVPKVLAVGRELSLVVDADFGLPVVASERLVSRLHDK